MATIQTLQIQRKLAVVLDLDGPEVSDQTISLTTLNPDDVSLTSSTSIPAVHWLCEKVTIPGGGSSDIDLTSWTDTEGESKNSYGKKVRVLRVQPASTNSGSITIAGAAVNPYELFGSGLSVEFPPGVDMQFYFANQLSTISSASGGGPTAITVSGTAADVVYVEMGIG